MLSASRSKRELEAIHRRGDYSAHGSPLSLRRRGGVRMTVSRSTVPRRAVLHWTAIWASGRCLLSLSTIVGHIILPRITSLLGQRSQDWDVAKGGEGVSHQSLWPSSEDRPARMCRGWGRRSAQHPSSMSPRHTAKGIVKVIWSKGELRRLQAQHVWSESTARVQCIKELE